MKTAISVPDDLYRAAEQAAKRLGLSRSALYRRALRAFLQEHSARLVTKALNEIYGEIYGREEAASCVDPVLSSLQRSSLLTDEW